MTSDIARPAAAGGRPRPWRFSGWHWAVVVVVMMAIGGVVYSYVLLNVAPRDVFWPSFYATNPITGLLQQPLSGEGAYQTLVLKSWLDTLIPFVPWMVVPYLAVLVIAPILVPLLNVAVGSFRRFLTVGLALIVGQGFLDLAYYLFQTNIVRDAVLDDDLPGQLIRQLWDNDQAFSRFPSAQVTWATIAILSLWRLRRRLPVTSWVLMACLVPVYPATLMLQQNYVIDVYAGVFVGFATYWACMFLIERPRLVPSNEGALDRRRRPVSPPPPPDEFVPLADTVAASEVVEIPVPEPWGDAVPWGVEAPAGVPVATTPLEEDAAQRAVAIAAYNRCWELLDTEKRSADEDADLLTCAFTSRYHWFVVGDDQSRIIAEWMVSRSAAAVGEPDVSITFGRRALARLGRGEQPAWLRASVYEGLARAYACAGDTQRREECMTRARVALESELNPEDRDLIAEQIAGVPEA